MLQDKSKVSKRCFVEYEIGPEGIELKLHTHVHFKKVMKIGVKFFVIAELLGNVVPEYSMEIIQVRSMHYIPKSARYIDSLLVAGDQMVHFFVQPKGASTYEVPVKELLASDIRRPTGPAREEEFLKGTAPRNFVVGKD